MCEIIARRRFVFDSRNQQWLDEQGKLISNEDPSFVAHLQDSIEEKRINEERRSWKGEDPAGLPPVVLPIPWWADIAYQLICFGLVCFVIAAIITFVPVAGATRVNFSEFQYRKEDHRVCVQLTHPWLPILSVGDQSPLAPPAVEFIPVAERPGPTPATKQATPQGEASSPRVENLEAELKHVRALLLEMLANQAKQIPIAEPKKLEREFHQEEPPLLEKTPFLFTVRIETILVPYTAACNAAWTVWNTITHTLQCVKLVMIGQWNWFCDVFWSLWHRFVWASTGLIPFSIARADSNDSEAYYYTKIWAAFVTFTIEVWMVQLLYRAIKRAYYVLRARGFPVGFRCETWMLKLWKIPVLWIVKIWTFRFVNKWSFSYAPPKVEVFETVPVGGSITVNVGGASGSIVNEGPTGTGRVFAIEGTQVPKVIANNQIAIGYRNKKGEVSEYGFAVIVRWMGEFVAKMPYHVVQRTKLEAKSAGDEFANYVCIAHIFSPKPVTIAIDEWQQAAVSPDPDYYCVVVPTYYVGFLQPSGLTIGDFRSQGEVVSYVSRAAPSGPQRLIYMITGTAECSTDDASKMVVHADYKAGDCGTAVLSVTGGKLQCVGYHVAYEKFAQPRGAMTGQSHAVRLHYLTQTKRKGEIIEETLTPKQLAAIEAFEAVARGQARFGGAFDQYQADKAARNFADQDDFTMAEPVDEEEEERLVEEYMNKRLYGMTMRTTAHSGEFRDAVKHAQQKYGPRPPKGGKFESGGKEETLQKIMLEHIEKVAQENARMREDIRKQSEILQKLSERQAQVPPPLDDKTEEERKTPPKVAARAPPVTVPVKDEIARGLQTHLEREVAEFLDAWEKNDDPAVSLAFAKAMGWELETAAVVPPKDKEEMGNGLSPDARQNASGPGTSDSVPGMQTTLPSIERIKAFLQGITSGFSLETKTAAQKGSRPAPVIPTTSGDSKPQDPSNPKSSKKPAASENAAKPKTGTSGGWAFTPEEWALMSKEERKAHNKAKNQQRKQAKSLLSLEAGEPRAPRSAYDREPLNKIRALLKVLYSQKDAASGAEAKAIWADIKLLQQEESKELEKAKAFVLKQSDEQQAFMAQLRSLALKKPDSGSLSTEVLQETPVLSEQP